MQLPFSITTRYISNGLEFILNLNFESDIQVEAELENAKNSMLWEIEQGRLAFWHRAEKCFRDHGCKPDTVGTFFEVTSMTKAYSRLFKHLYTWVGGGG